MVVHGKRGYHSSTSQHSSKVHIVTADHLHVSTPVQHYQQTKLKAQAPSPHEAPLTPTTHRPNPKPHLPPKLPQAICHWLDTRSHIPGVSESFSPRDKGTVIAKTFFLQGHAGKNNLVEQIRHRRDRCRKQLKGGGYVRAKIRVF